MAKAYPLKFQESQEYERLVQAPREASKEQPSKLQLTFIEGLVLLALAMVVFALDKYAFNWYTNKLRTQVPIQQPALTSASLIPTDQKKPETYAVRDKLPSISGGPLFVVLPAGSFVRGDGKTVRIASFAMAEIETTTAQYMACVRDGGCQPPAWAEAGSKYHLQTGSDPHYLGFSADNQPAVGVRWSNALQYAVWLSKKVGHSYYLPSEAQWEYAARAGSSAQWSFGNNESELGHYSWYATNSGGKTHRVAQKKPNDYGLFDLHGNAWEWVQDCIQNYADVSSDGTAAGSDGDRNCERVLRGGAWLADAKLTQSAGRFSTSPGSRANYVGFRLARTL